MSFAEKWQFLLDKINERIPIKKLTSIIDKHNPLLSFYIFILIILVVLYIFVYPSIISGIGSSTPTYKDITIKLADDSGKILSNFEFSIKDSLTGIEKTYITDSFGKKVVSLNTNQEYYFVVEKKGYYLFEEKIDTSQLDFKAILKIFEMPSTTQKTLSFIDAQTEQIIQEPLNLSIRCESGDVISPQQVSVLDGEYSFEIPNNCGSLIATANSNTYSTESVIIPSTESIVKINPNDQVYDTGEVKVTVKSGDNFIDGITVKLFDIDDQVNPIRTGETVWSSIKFRDLPVGNYKVVASDSSNRYLSESIDVEVIKDDLVVKTINMIDTQPENGGSDQNIIDPDTNLTIQTREISAIIKDYDTGEEINDQLLDPTLTLLVDSNQTYDIRSYNQAFTFIIEEGKDYSLKATAEGYIPNIIPVTSNNNNYIIYLEKITISNVSDINSFIYDEDNLPVSNARVLIYDSETEFIDPRFDVKTTDENGNVLFENLPQGNFFLKVKKNYIEGRSNDFNHIPPEDSNINVPVEIGEGTLKLNIKNSYGDLIDNSQVTIFLLNGDVLGQDFANNTYSKNIKADKRVYVKIEKEGYMPYFTEIINLQKNVIILKEIILLQEYLGEVPNIEYLGIYDTSKQETEVLKNNSVFYFKYRLTIPKDKDTGGFIFKIGQKTSALEDIVYIKDIDNTLGVAKYYQEEPFSIIVNSENKAKLVDIFYQEVPSGTYEITIPIKIENAQINDVVPIFFTSYTENILDYMNNSLFENYQYYIDAENLCSNLFCFKGQYVDKQEDLRYDISNNLEIPMLVNSEYLLEYVITNSKNTNFENARMSVKNTDLSGNPIQILNIKNYDVSGSFNDSGSSQEENYKIPFDDSEFLSESIDSYSSTDFILNTTPLNVGQSKLSHQFISDQEVIYDLGLNILSENLYTMQIDYVPKNIMPGIEFDLTIFLTDQDGNPVDFATVNIYQKMSNYKSPIYVGKKTDSAGKLDVTIPAMQKGEILIIEAQKSSYLAEDISIEITEDILYLEYNSSELTNQSPVSINIHKNKLDGTIDKIIIENKTKYDLVLNDFKSEDISFESSSLLDLGKTLSFLNSQVNAEEEFIIPAESKKQLEIKIVPGANAQNLVESENINGSITGHVSREGANYVFNIPITVQISVGEGVNEDNCLVAIGYSNPWTSVINGAGSQSMSFTIQNNCRLKEDPTQPVTLKNVQAKIVSQADSYGYYDLMVNSSTTRLAEGLYKTVFTDVEPDTPYSATLSYSAGATRFGNVKTKIYLNGQIETDQGLVNVNNGAGEELLDTDFRIMQISECIEIKDSDGVINKGGMFEIPSDVSSNNGSKDLIIANKCADVSRFKVTLCPNKVTDTACQDLDFGNTSGAQQNEVEFSIGDSEKRVQVYKPEIPGAYLLDIQIEALDNRDRVVATVHSPLKINVKDILWTEDPFLEVKDNKTATIKLYNNDINTTPWDYAEKVGNSAGFSKFMEDNDSENYFEKMLFNPPNTLENIGESHNSTGWIVGGSVAAAAAVATAVGEAAVAAATITTTVSSVAAGTVTTTASSASAIASVGASLFPVGTAAIAVVAIGMLIASGMHNEYLFVPEYQLLDVPNDIIQPNAEYKKSININNFSEEEKRLNVFDITGANYFSYLKLRGYTDDASKNKLYKDEMLEESIPKCNGAEHKTIYDDYKIINNHKNCDSEFTKYKITDDSINYGVKCYGAAPPSSRNKIDLEFEAYTACKYDEVLWPEQVGFKPLEFTFNSGAINEIKNNNFLQMYKTYMFYPNFGDSDTSIDPAFENSKPIGNNGKYRFAYYLATDRETPNVDLNVFDCMTDSDKLGHTGPGAVPNINLDWTWNSNSINDCENNYCDATQLTQVILNRIEKTKQFLENKEISCPKSTQQLVLEDISGTYTVSSDPDGVINNIPAGKTGISLVSLNTSENQFILKVAMDNRTTASQDASLSVNFGNYTPVDVMKYNVNTEEYEDVLVSGNYSLTIPFEENKNSVDYLFYYGSEDNIIEDENIPLDITFSANATDPTYTKFNTLVSLGVFKYEGTDECLVPATTSQYRDIDSIDFWFNKKQYRNANVNWSQQDIDTLRNLLQFNAYLITDNYNDNFITSFDRTYGGQASKEQGIGLGPYALMSSPSVFNGDAENGYLSKLFKNNLQFTLKYSNNQEGVNISVPGKYRVRIDLLFNNPDWDFLRNNNVDVNSFVTFSYIKGPENDSAFYRLPFDGYLGYSDSGYNRQGYGLGYLGDNIIIGKMGNLDVRTYNDTGSNPYDYLIIEKQDDFFKLNSEVGTRGNLLTISKENNQTKMTYSPSYATPVNMTIENNNLNPFEVYYRLIKESDEQIIYGNDSLTRWSGVGNEVDFSGDYVYSVFNNTFDRRSEVGDEIPNAYMLEWPVVNSKGKIELRSIFYTPYNEGENKYYTLIDKSGSNPSVNFITSESDNSIVDIPTQDSFYINSLEDIFEGVKDNKVCVTNSADGSTSEFWWNPAKVYESTNNVN